ncbi:MAG: EAL domain-containing protein [Prochloraceae cyanobacterium]|nr:EAL domain-containing protein [Prochloraceae cyanobacterium]
MDGNKLSYLEHNSYNKQPISSLVKELEKSIALKSTIKYLLKFEELIIKVSTRFINLQSLQIPAAIQETLQEIGEFSQVDTSYIFLFDKDKKNFSMAFEWVKKGRKTVKQLAQNLTESNFPWDLQIILNKKILYLPRIIISENLNPETRNNYLAFDFKSLICIPLIFEGKVLGWFTLASVTENKTWKKNDIKRLKIFTEILAHALQIQENKQALLINEDRYSTLAKISPVGIFQTDPQGNCIYANQKWCQIAGLSQEEALGRGWSRALHPEDRETVFSQWYRATSENLPFQAEYRFKSRDGKITWVLGQALAEKDRFGQVTSYVGTITDISDRKQVEAQRERDKNFLQTLIDYLPVALFVKSGKTENFGELLLVNSACEELFGLQASQLIGKTAKDLFPQERADFYDRKDRIAFVRRVAEDIPAEEIDSCSRGRRILHTIKVPLYDENQESEYLLCISSDITDRKRAEDKLRHDAFHDALTGLPNRTFLIDRLDNSLSRLQQEPDFLFGVLFLDLDRFKIINDSLGHLVGDQLLIGFSKRLQKCLRHNDTLARLGGDEFVILLEDLQHQDDALEVAQRIHRALKQPFVLKEQEIFVSTSIGIALSSTYSYREPAQLLRDADTAMYSAKTSGKSCHCFFDTSMYDRASKQLRLENDLQRAIEREQLFICYQPIFSLKDNQIQSIEALVRWQHHSLGLIHPQDIIPLAEENGFIVPLDLWILENASRQVSLWKKQFPAFAQLGLNVNFSGKQFIQSNLAAKVESILSKTNLDPRHLKLEMTESVLIKNCQSVLSILNQFREQQIQICLDDFGTGYSSLSYLDRFAFDILKIDRSFIHKLSLNNSQQSIVRAIVVMARELNIKVIAEGIEDSIQLDFLQSLNCFGGQGFLFSQPLNTQEMTDLLQYYSSPNRDEFNRLKPASRI